MKFPKAFCKYLDTLAGISRFDVKVGTVRLKIWSSQSLYFLDNAGSKILKGKREQFFLHFGSSWYVFSCVNSVSI